MAGKISELTPKATPTGSEEVEVRDGSSNVSVTLQKIAGLAVGGAYDAQMSFYGTPANGQVLGDWYPARAGSAVLQANSFGKAAAAATAETVLSLKKNGAEVATVTFAAAGTDGTVSASPAIQSFVAGDHFQLVNAATADATLADIHFALYATHS